MALIQLTTEELRTSAQKYTQGSEEVRQISYIDSRAKYYPRQLERCCFWELWSPIHRIVSKIEEFATLLDEINAQLNKVAEIVEQTTKILHQNLICYISGFRRREPSYFFYDGENLR